MKLRKRLTALIAASAILLSLAACGQKDPEPTQGSNPGQQTETNNPEQQKTIMFYIPYIGDFGLGDMGYRASTAAAEKYNLKFNLVEYGQDNSIAVNSLVDALETTHYDYVLAMGWYVTDIVVEKSKSGEWSDITFILFDTAPSMDFEGCDNIYGVSFAQNEGSFLVALYSALMTKSGKIGCAINQDAPITNDFGTGWLCGYKYAVNELGMDDLEMMYAYLGEVTIQTSYETVSVMMDNDCDYVYLVAGTVAMGGMQAAEEKGGKAAGKFILGTDYDQYNYFKEVGDTVGYDTMLTSMLKNIEACVALIFENIYGEATGIEPGNHVYGIKEGGVGLAQNENYLENTPEDVQKVIQETSDKIVSGELDVVSYFDFDSYDAFATYRDNPSAPFVP
ncbi:MAG: BMP family ABC transporter substrate-binding protein [Oscillospiraceae bacterium]|nr:BMP family ABC transporter substrate-binding protein [Oscillospiraceae bacterium]